MFGGRVHEGCVASVIVPVRNEEERLSDCLEALGAQVDLQGARLPEKFFEVLLLLNNCTDRSAQIALEWKNAHPRVILHIAERTFRPEAAHVGTARKLLMDTAWWRLDGASGGSGVILSTDADSTVAPDWIAQNLQAIARGADAVGGAVLIRPEHVAAMSEQVQRCFQQNCRYGALLAELEDWLDPQPGDCWPRHLHHFGSSLACTARAYALSGGMPALPRLEDEAFVDRLRHASRQLRHEPAVRVFTSARLDGRTGIGMAGQLRLWNAMEGETEHTVQSAAFLAHRFKRLRWLREIFAGSREVDCLLPLTDWWQNHLQICRVQESNEGGFLGAIYCDILIEDAFHGAREQPIAEAIADLELLLRAFRCGNKQE